MYKDLDNSKSYSRWVINSLRLLPLLWLTLPFFTSVPDSFPCPASPKPPSPFSRPAIYSSSFASGNELL